jgi:hypothetical protein
MSFLKDVVHAAGKGVAGVFHVAALPGELVVKGAQKIPVVGKPIGSVFHFANAPLSLAEHIASGDRLDRAVIANIKGQVKDVRATAPYAQMVISFVPGIGTLASGAIGAGLALAAGQPITGVLMAGVEGMIPGGTIGKSLFTVSKDMIEKKKLTDIEVDVLPLNSLEKASIKATLNLAMKQSQGKTVTHAEAVAAQAGLSPANRSAMAVALAMGQAQQTQQDMLANVTNDTLTALQQQGQSSITVHPTVKAGEALLKTADEKRGFEIGTGLMLYELYPMHVSAVQGKLKNDGERHGFDLALAGHVGGVNEGKTQFSNPQSQFAYRATLGARNAGVEFKGRIVKTSTANVHATVGTLEAAKQVAVGKEHWWVRWWHELEDVLGITHTS